MKHDFVQATELPALIKLNRQFPVRSEDTVISQVAVSKAIELEDLLTKKEG